MFTVCHRTWCFICLKTWTWKNRGKMGQASCRTSPFIPFQQSACKQPSQIYRIEVAQSVLHVPRASRFCPWFCTCVAWQQIPTSHHCLCTSLWGDKNITSVNWPSELSWIGEVCVRRQPHSHGIQDIGRGSGESLLCRERFQDVLNSTSTGVSSAEFSWDSLVGLSWVWSVPWGTLPL